MGKLERLDAHRARMEAWLRNCFLEREPRGNLYDAMRYSLLELHRPTVGLHNLPHQLEAQAVFPALGTGDIRFLVQRLQPDIIHPHAIIGHCAGASPILRAHRNRDMAPLGIVDDAVADQVVQHPPEEGGVTLHPGGTARMLFRELNLIPFRQAAIEHLAHRLPPDLRQIHRLPADGLEGVLQLGGQVQILYQRFQTLPLLPDPPGLVTGLRGESVVILQFAGVAQYHGEGSADVVGDTADPLRPGLVPLFQGLSLTGQQARGAV